MRALVFLLVLGNILVFALSAGWFGGGDGAASTTAAAVTAPGENAEGHVPLSPDRIKIVSRGDPPPIAEPAMQCFEWRELLTAQLTALEKQAAGNKALGLVREETQSASASYWVYIPAPVGGKAASEKKVQELKTLGVKSMQLVQEGSADRWSVSLGVFANEQAAADALAELKKIGVRSAKVGLKSETPSLFYVRVSGPAIAMAAARKLIDPAVPTECSVDGVTPSKQAESVVVPEVKAVAGAATVAPAPVATPAPASSSAPAAVVTPEPGAPATATRP